MKRRAIQSLPICLGAALFNRAISGPAGATQSENFKVNLEGRERVPALPRALPECRPASDDEEEIVICANPREQERYRLPRQAWNPDGSTQSVSRERHSLYEQGDSGIGSCSTVGPGGWTGCALRTWKAAREQHGR